MAASSFPALPGFYETFFLHIEPISTIASALPCWFFPGAKWFFDELVPGLPPTEGALDPRATMVLWQYANCFLLIGLISSLVLRAVRTVLADNPYAQQRIVGALLKALTIADMSHITLTLLCLPADVRFKPSSWNALTHGNVSYVVLLLTMRVSWCLGICRKKYSKTDAVMKRE